MALFHPKPNNECLRFDLESCNLMCTYTVVTHPCHISPLAQARPMMLCIYTSFKIMVIQRRYTLLVQQLYVGCFLVARDIWNEEDTTQGVGQLDVNLCLCSAIIWPLWMTLLWHRGGTAPVAKSIEEEEQVA